MACFATYWAWPAFKSYHGIRDVYLGDADLSANLHRVGEILVALIWFHAPHLPVVAGKKHVAPYKLHSVYERNYYGCATALDEQIGRLRKGDTLPENEVKVLCNKVS